MNVIKKIFSLIQKLFNRNKILKLDSPKQIKPKELHHNFLESLKIPTGINKRKVIDTLICPGTGLGIQGKISY